MGFTETMLTMPEENDASSDLTLEKMSNLKEVAEQLRKYSPGVVVFDLDFTLKPKVYELGMGGKEPGRLPVESVELLKELKDLGWQIMVVTNQPIKGHQVAKAVRNIQRADYPIFPTTIQEVLGEENVMGGGRDFLWKKFKKTNYAVDKAAKWIDLAMEVSDGPVVFVGDRDSDIEFANKVTQEIDVRNKTTIFLKLEGINLPKPLKSLEKFIP